MISHKYRCIFIHIPRCAGTSIETWLTGHDWWAIEPKTKHLIASQARKFYSDVWNRYFKFAFVRHPVDRMISCLGFGDHFGLSYDRTNGFSFSRYHELFGKDVVLEHDYRFWKRDDLLAACHRPGSVYCNILDEQLDFIGRLENFHQDMKFIASAIGKTESFNVHTATSVIPHATSQSLSKADALYIETMYRNDMAEFSYESILSKR